jgi:energy-coupling factor transporter ATP-binding protein EcfA2
VPSTVSYDELLRRARDRLERSQPATRPGRELLVALLDELRGTQDDTGDPELLGKDPWRIAAVSVRGFGGIGNPHAPLALDLAPVPGVTVVRGDNGSGKSSLAGAIGWLLAGRPESPVPGSTPGELWRAAAVADGAARAEVEVRLVRSADTLTLTGALSPDGGEITARLCTDGDTTTVSLGPAWTDALTAANACFAYADLQGRLRTPADLQEYLEGLLVLGPAWLRVHTEVSDRAERSRAAAKALAAALEQTRARIADLDAEAPGRVAAPPVRWPTDWSEDPAAWAAAHLDGDPAADPRPDLPDDLERTADRLATGVEVASERLAEVESRIAAPATARVLHHLRELIEHRELPEGSCPLCGRSAGWRDHARHVVEGLDGLVTEHAAVARAVAALQGWCRMLPDAAGPAPAALLAAVERTGCAPHTAAHRAALDVVAWLRSPEFAGWARKRRAESMATARWRQARRTALAELAATWAEHPDAARAGAWETARATMADIQKDLRQQRQDELTGRLRAAVDTLLPDAGVQLQEIRHRGGAARRFGLDVRLRIGERDASLGMLSSGQRNALLLASLLCVDGGASFGFLVIDDPVHALDDLRVDLLARELTRLAADRQVLVLTHDGRLEEHLRARNPDLETVVLARDPDTATVRVSARHSPWEHLLVLARRFVDGAHGDGWRVDGPVDGIVAGLCRNALDGAVRQSMINVEVARGGGVAAALQRLDEHKTTRARLAHLFKVLGGSATVPLTAACEATHLGRWNRAAHGERAVLLDHRHEIDIAAAACAELQAVAR